MGQYAGALPLAQRALAITEEALGPEHPEVVVSLKSLALLFHAEGKDAEALPFAGRALAIREQALGPEHPEVAESLNLLAELSQALGREHPGVLPRT